MNSQETTENFIKAWSQFVWPELVKPSYRLYYNNDGTPICYSMDEMPDKYIEVDAETFAQRPWNVQVIDSKLTHVVAPVTVQKLQPSQATGTACHVQDVCVIVSTDQTHTRWNKIINEIS